MAIFSQPCNDSFNLCRGVEVVVGRNLCDIDVWLATPYLFFHNLLQDRQGYGLSLLKVPYCTAPVMSYQLLQNLIQLPWHCTAKRFLMGQDKYLQAGSILIMTSNKERDTKWSLTIDSSSPSPKRRAKSQIACVVDSTVIGSPYENL
ncbi:Os11g0615750 [Oryza sativa Japonica Group]|uniref:Os11g0615750 protein n=1 Tax=Oryza sativa subsp. japonica TaxID=39947 RepID=A0A0P0Y4C1_ORYSJ|nr:hypothetical protein EE612_056647 [Oryza sativa]BAT14861.1 Os11g0615750 [Oryza sativa Japonica Group]